MNVEELERRGTILLKYALELAEIQAKGKRHFLLENPLTSKAWSQEDMKKFLEEQDVHIGSFHLCRFGLKGASGLHHRKATKVASSSREVVSLIDGRKCLGDHIHQPVIGGSAVSGPAGHYPLQFAKKLVDGIEKEFNKETAKSFEINASQISNTIQNISMNFWLTADSSLRWRDTHLIDVTIVCTDSFPATHPLFQVQAQAILDRLDPETYQVRDHGTWDGRWEMPMISDKTRANLGLSWPCGRHEFEVAAVQAARKEYQWRSMSAAQKAEFKVAAEKGWQVWVDNDAVEVLKPHQAKKVWRELKLKQETHKVLTPRFVFTDKNDGLRTSEKDLPLLASGRLVVPGFRDVTAYQIRKDAPTASRIRQHLVMVLTSCNFKHGWRLWSADVKSAFLKGDAYMSGVRELYVSNIRTSSPDEPVLPLGPDGLARVRKGVFGLADAPRQWYLRLNRSLEAREWKRSLVDSACWMLWAADGSLDGVVVSHVDDLLLGGNQRAQDELHALGAELGFGSVSTGCFQYCGKMIKQDETTGIITVSMVEYHDNLKTIEVPVHRRREGNAALTPGEHKSLRALLGSLQWLVAQVRFDQGYQLSVLQGEPPVVETILKANMLAKGMKQTKEFALTFKPFELSGSGLVVVADASLGNGRRDGSAGSDPFEKVYSQSSYFVLVGDADLLAGKEGTFAILDARSHRLSRVCRSTFAAELYSTEEAFDVGMYCRGVLTESRGHSLGSKVVDAVLETVPLVVVTDAKDVYDKNTSDTPSYGSQKSLAFTVAWLRNLLRREGTKLKWTSTENTWVDGGTKDMNLDHMHKIIQSCRWSLTYSPSFVKQPSKAKAKPIKPSLAVVGTPIGSDDAVFTHLLRLGSEPGWHLRGGVAIHVAKGAKSFRLPQPRFDPEEYPLRSSFGRFDGSNGQSEWRRLEDHVSYQDLPNKQALIGDHVPVLVTFFHAKPFSTNKEDIPRE